MGSAKESATKAYIRLPKTIRSFTDPIVKNRGKAQKTYQERHDAGKKIVTTQIRRLFGGKKSRGKKK